MNAAEIAAALGGAQREGRAWRCRCPLHGGRSLVIRDGDGGRVLVKCWAGCDRRDVLPELRRRGLLSGGAHHAPRIAPAPQRQGEASRIARAVNIWRNTQRGAGSLAERYLISRGITPEPWPAALRFHQHCPRPRDDASKLVASLPAMVALVEHAELGPIAVHCTYLRSDGSGKADVERQKVIFGPVAGGAVRFGMPLAEQWFVAAEGIETALAVAVASAMPVWAALSAGGIKNLVLPPEATSVVVCADHDATGTGERAARDAAARWFAEGRRVRVAIPPEPDTDFADLLLGRATDKTDEQCHVTV